MEEENTLTDNENSRQGNQENSENVNHRDDSSGIEGALSTPGSLLTGASGIAQWFKKIPGVLKLGMLKILFSVLLMLISVLMIVAVLSAPVTVAVELTQFLGEQAEKVGDFFQGIVRFVTSPFNPDLEKKAEQAQQAYYKKLEQIYTEYKNKYNVEIDIALITATLFYNRTIGDYLQEDISEEEGKDEVEDIQNDIDFFKSAKNSIKTLAKYQIVETSNFNACSNSPTSASFPETAKEVADAWKVLDFGFNSRRNFYYTTYTSIPYTKADGTTGSITWCPYDDANTQLRSHYEEDKNYVSSLKSKYDSCVQSKKQALLSECEKKCMVSVVPGSPNLNQYQDCVNKCESEKNPWEYECPKEKLAYEAANKRYQANWLNDGLYNENGNFSCTSTERFGLLSSYPGNYTFNKDAINTGAFPALGAAISCSSYPSVEITYTVDTAREGVYYHKLLSKNSSFLRDKSFIEIYYPERVNAETEEERDELAIEIVDGIYDMYEDIAKKTMIVKASNLCPNGITVVPGTGEYSRDPSKFPVGTFSLEDYVAMVVNGENNSGYDEAMKAQIVAARTYTLARTDGCTKPIRNSTQDQVAKANPSEKIKQLVLDTSGEVLMYNGKVFSAEYDSFLGSCSGGMCTGTYTKLPNRETHTVSVPSSFGEGIGGHGRGMSQVAANYMASQGTKYQDILKYFYSPGVEIVAGFGVSENTVNTGNVLSPNGITQALATGGYTLDSYSSEMFASVKASGLSTRQAVLTVANYATSKFYSVTGGMKLNYYFGGGHGESYAIYGFYSPFTRDCSSFISWVLYNAGFSYMNYTSGPWGNSGQKAPISQRQGVPGDLLWFNGHIALIIGSDDEGYYTAEAHSPGAGIVTSFYPYTKTYSGKGYPIYTVDMTNFYQTHIETNNYPS